MLPAVVVVPDADWHSSEHHYGAVLLAVGVFVAAGVLIWLIKRWSK